MQKHDLILIANSIEARLYTRASGRDLLVLLDSLEQDSEARRKPSEQGADHPGHGSTDNRPGGVNFAPRIDPRHKLHLQFAERLSKRIDQELSGGRCGRIAVFACNPFLGELKSRLSHGATKALGTALDVDLTHLPIGELQQRVRQALPPGAIAGA